MPDDFLFNHSATHGGDNVLHDYFNDDLEVPIHDPTDAQVCKFNFFKRLAHYSNGSRISNRNCKAVKLVILAEAGTYVRGLDPMKRAKQEDIFMLKYLHIVNNIEVKLFEKLGFCPPIIRFSNKFSFSPFFKFNSSFSSSIFVSHQSFLLFFYLF